MVGGGRKLRCMGCERYRLWLAIAADADELVRIGRVEAAAAQSIAGGRDGRLTSRPADARRT